MAVEPKSIDLRIRAVLEQGLAPLDQTVAKLQALMETQAQIARGNTDAVNSEKQYTDSLNATTAAVAALVKVRGQMAELSRRQNAVDQAAVELASRQNGLRNAQGAFGLPNATPQMRAAIEESQGRLEAQERVVALVNARFQEQITLLQRIGVLTQEATKDTAGGQIAEQQTQIDALLNKGLDTIEQMRAGEDGFVAALRRSLALAEQFEAIEKRRVALVKERAAAMKKAVLTAEEEGAALEKAQAAIGKFVAEFQQAKSAVGEQASAAAARNAAQTAALAHPAPPPAPTPTAEISAALRPPSGPGTGTIGDIQSEVVRLNAIFATGGSEARIYTTALRDLDKVYTEIDRDAKAITGLQARQEAVENSTRAFNVAVTAVDRLKAALATAGDTADVAAIGSQISKLQREIGTTETTGLASKLAADKEALAEEMQAVRALGVDVDHLSAEYQRLKETAISAAEARSAAEKRAQAEIVAAIEKTKEQRDALLTGINAPRQVSAPSLVETVSTIVPARGTPREIDDVSAAIDRLSESTGKNKLTAEGLNRAMSELHQIQKQVVSDASLIDNFTRQDKAAQAARQSFADASKALADLEARSKEAGGGGVTREQITRAQGNLTSSSDEVLRTQQALTDLNAKLQQRKINTEQLDQATQHLVATMTRLATVERGLEGSGQKIFGLNQYQVQNLGFQINDVVTQLSLGQGIFRTIASQGGQIFQIFDVSIASLKNIALYALAAGPPVLALLASYQRFTETEGAQRRFQALLQGSALAANTTATALVRIQREVENLGVKFTDAGKAITQFTLTGLNTAQIERYATAAANLSVGLGKPIEEVSKAFNDIPTAGADRLLEILQSFGLLTGPLTKEILDLYALGRAAEAQTIVFDALKAHSITARREGVTPLGEETIKLTKAWNDFLDAISNSAVFTLITKNTTDLLNSVSSFFQVLSGGASDVGGALKAFYDLDGRINGLISPINRAQNEVLKFMGLLDRRPGTLLDAVKAKIETLTKDYQAAKVEADRLNAEHPGSSWAEAQAATVTRLKTQLEAAVALKERFERPGGLTGTTPTGEVAPGTPGALPTLGLAGQKYDVAAANEITQGLVARGMALQDAIAFTANAIRESGANFKSVNMADAPGGSHGLFQWNTDRLERFKTQNEGKLPEETSIKAQLDFVMNEITTKFTDAYQKIRQEPDQGNKARLVTSEFEIPKDKVGQGNVSARIAQQLAAVAPGPSAAIDPNSPLGQSSLEQTKRALKERLDAVANEAAKGFSDAAVAQDAKFVQQVIAEETKFANDKNKNIALDQAAQDQRDTIINTRIEARRQQREREDLEDRKLLDNSIASATQKVDNLAKARGDVEAAERAFRASEVPALNAAKDALHKLGPGAKTADGQDAKSVVDSLSAGIEEGVRQARTDAAKVGFDAAVETLNNQAAAAQTAFGNSSITLTEMFTRISAAVTENAPKIRAAQQVALEELAKAPNNPKNIAALAAVQNADLTGRTVTKAADTTGETDLQQRVQARNTLIKEAQDLATRGFLTTRDSETKIQEIYKQTAPAILENVKALQTQYDLQLASNQITLPEYQKRIAALKTISVETSNVTKQQQELDRGFEQSVSSHTIEALDGVGQAIGGLISGQLTWGQAITATGKAFAQMALGIVRDIASIIIKQELLNSIQQAGGFSGILKTVIGFVGAAAGGATGSAEPLSTAPTFQVRHTGGRIGDVPLMTRRVALPSAFTAGVFHSGGVAGLKYNESMAVVEDGEVIMNKQQQAQEARTRKAMKEAAGSVTVTPIVAFGEDQVAEAILNAPSGNKVFVTQAKRNAGFLRQIIRP